MGGGSGVADGLRARGTRDRDHDVGLREVPGQRHLVHRDVQLVGHLYEGRKPAFLDDLIGLLIGPLFVVAEIGALLGLRRDLKATIEAKTGPERSLVKHRPVEKPE